MKPTADHGVVPHRDEPPEPDGIVPCCGPGPARRHGSPCSQRPLPAELASLAGLQALRIRHDRLEADVEWLASVLAKHVPALSPVHTIVPVARRGFGRPVAILAATATVLAIAALLVWMSLPTYTVG